MINQFELHQVQVINGRERGDRDFFKRKLLQ